MLPVFDGEVLRCLGSSPSAHPVEDMPGIIYEFHGILSLVIWVLDVVAALVGFSILNPIGHPLDVSRQVCGSSGGDDQPLVSNKILKEGVLASYFGSADGFWTDGPDMPSDCL